MNQEKKYGLIVKETKKNEPFYESKKLGKESKIVIDKALEEDPNIFAYDEVYDDFKKTEEKKVKKQSRYIENLKIMAEKRKVTEESRINRKIQKERDLEGNEFADKEIIITDAYKQKLIERNIYEQREKREIEIEELMEKSKNKNGMSSFYRNFINQKVGEKLEKKTEMYLDKLTEDLKKELLESSEKKPEAKTEFKKSIKNDKNKRQRRSSSSSEEEISIKSSIKNKKEKTKKTFEIIKPQIKDKNLDSKEIEMKEDSDKKEKIKEKLVEDDEKSFNEPINAESKKDNDNLNENQEINLKDDNINEEPEVKLSLKEVLVKIFTKKCIDEEFENQQKKYFERKSLLQY